MCARVQCNKNSSGSLVGWLLEVAGWSLECYFLLSRWLLAGGWLLLGCLVSRSVVGCCWLVAW